MRAIVLASCCVLVLCVIVFLLIAPLHRRVKALERGQRDILTAVLTGRDPGGRQPGTGNGPKGGRHLSIVRRASGLVVAVIIWLRRHPLRVAAIGGVAAATLTVALVASGPIDNGPTTVSPGGTHTDAGEPPTATFGTTSETNSYPAMLAEPPVNDYAANINRAGFSAPIEPTGAATTPTSVNAPTSSATVPSSETATPTSTAGTRTSPMCTLEIAVRPIIDACLLG